MKILTSLPNISWETITASAWSSEAFKAQFKIKDIDLEKW